MDRKTFLKTSFVLGTSLPFLGCLQETTQVGTIEKTWDAGEVAHILPTVNHQRILVTTSFKRVVNAPVLKVGNKSIKGQKRDSKGYFWIFDCENLEPATNYTLRLSEQKEPLCDAWELKTFPHPDKDIDHLKLLVYTCAGGHPLSQKILPIPEDQKESPEHFAERRIKLLNRGLSFQPDALISIGDQVYWDLSGNGKNRPGVMDMDFATKVAGKFDPSQAVLGTKNEDILIKAVSPQIIDLYGTACRSTPVFFFNDDHDYFENDEANDTLITFPPKPFQLELGRAVQRLFFPEFLPDTKRPISLPASNASDRVKHSSESFGTLRYGRLAELLMYDCRRFVSLEKAKAVFIPSEAEQWLTDRIADNQVKHTIQVPSTPFGWSAGKWLEWYPDLLGKDQKLHDDLDKYMWQEGWQLQHDRILQAMHDNKAKKPIMLSGDLHAFGAGKLHRNKNSDFSKNPIFAFLTGPLGSNVFPSTFRGIKASIPTAIGNEEYFENLEENGFSIVDISSNNVQVSMFKYLWSRDNIEVINSLSPFEKILAGR